MRPFLIFVIFVAVITAPAQVSKPGTLTDELKNLHVHTALLFPSQAIDDLPLWSSDAKYLAVNIQCKWHKLDTSLVLLQEARWHGKSIATLKDGAFSDATESEIAEWSKGAKEKRTVESKSGIKAELPQHEMSTSLVLSKGRNRKSIWKTDLESCYGLRLSPDGHTVAFLCETNGVFAMDVDAAFASE